MVRTIGEFTIQLLLTDLLDRREVFGCGEIADLLPQITGG